MMRRSGSMSSGSSSLSLARRCSVSFRSGVCSANQLQLEGRLVVDQHAAVAVENQAAAGRDRILAYAITLREFQVVVVADDLQVDELAEQAQAQHADDEYRREACGWRRCAARSIDP